MTTYDDTQIDSIVWQAICESTCPDDFRNYLRHAPEQAAHRDDALERLIELDDGACASRNGSRTTPWVTAYSIRSSHCAAHGIP